MEEASVEVEADETEARGLFLVVVQEELMGAINDVLEVFLVVGSFCVVAAATAFALQPFVALGSGRGVALGGGAAEAPC